MERVLITTFTEEDLKTIISECIKEEFAKVKPLPGPNKSLTAHLRVKDLTMLLGVSKVTIGMWVKKGILKAYKLGNKRIYFKREEVEELLKQKEVPMKHITTFKQAAKDLDSDVWFRIKQLEKEWGMPIENIHNPEAEELKHHKLMRSRKVFHD
jgi:excisionase family DNA binding protein